MNKILFSFILSLLLLASESAYSESKNLCVGKKKIYVRQACHEDEELFSKSIINLGENCALTKKGLKGQSGAKGEAGGAGNDGLSYGEVVSPGTILFGEISGESVEKTTYSQYARAGFLAKLKSPIPHDKIIIKIPEENMDGCVSGDPCIEEDYRTEEKQSLCKGDASDPKPEPGILCIYPIYFINVANLEAEDDSSLFGFSLEYYTRDYTKFSAFSAVWAYAPENQ